MLAIVGAIGSDEEDDWEDQPATTRRSGRGKLQYILGTKTCVMHVLEVSQVHDILLQLLCGSIDALAMLLLCSAEWHSWLINAGCCVVPLMHWQWAQLCLYQ